ncbi:MAG: pentapeptide repeat-containing protein [Niameybacter sp.]
MAINFKNTQKLNKNFMYQDLKRSNCFDVDFSGSNFDFASLRGAHLKGCNFYKCSFKSTEFVGTNCKKVRFKNAKFEDAIFEGANLNGADFAGATFKNTVFLSTDLSVANNLDLKNSGITVYETMPELEMSEELKTAILDTMENEFVKNSRVLDTKEGEINNLSIMRLLEHYDEKALIRGFKIMKPRLDKEFCTLSYLTKVLQTYKEAGFL